MKGITDKGLVNQGSAYGFNGFPDPGCLMAGKIVHHHDVAGLKRGHQDLTDIFPEHGAIHGAIDHHRRCELIVSQRSHEGRGFPVPPRSMSHEPLALQSATVESNQVGAEAAFIDEYKLSHIQGRHQDLPTETLLMNIGPLLLGGMQDFFLKVSFKRWRARAMVASPTLTPNC
jgi:hypothetical protein